jgi:hypothetical protein
MEGILGETQKANIVAIREAALEKLFQAAMDELKQKVAIDPAAKRHTIYPRCKDEETAMHVVARFMGSGIKAKLVKGWTTLYIVCEIEGEL